MVCPASTPVPNNSNSKIVLISSSPTGVAVFYSTLAFVGAEGDFAHRGERWFHQPSATGFDPEHGRFGDGAVRRLEGFDTYWYTWSLINTETDETVTYRIVGEDEADVKSNLISVVSPIARALVGKEEGDVVTVKAPGGDIEYEIDQVHHV